MKRLLGAGAWVFGGILLGRVIGYVRELVIAQSFGTGATSDVVVAALTLPDIMLNLLVGGAVGAALVPEFTRRTAGEGWRLHQAVLMRMGAFFLVVAAVAALFPVALVRAIGSGFSAEQVVQAAPLVQAIVFVVPLTAAAAVTRAYLHAHQRFATASLSTFLYNCVLVAGVLAVRPSGTLQTLAVAGLVGAAIAWLCQIGEAKGVRGAEPDGAAQTVDRELVKRYGQALAAGGLILVLPLLARSAASLDGPGAFTRLHYAIKVIELPLGTLLTVLSVALFPSFASLFAAPERRERAVTLAALGTRVSLILAVAVAIPLAVLGPDVAQVLFGYGEMGAEGARAVGPMVAWMTIAMVAQAVSTLWLSVCHALRDMARPFWVGFVGLVLGGASWVLLRDGLGGEPAVAVGYSVTHLTFAAGLAWILGRMHGVRLVTGALTGRGVVAILGAAGLAGATSGLAFAMAAPVVVKVVIAVLGGLAAMGVGLKLSGAAGELREARTQGSGEGENRDAGAE